MQVELTPELRAAITEVYDLAEQNMDHHYCGMCGEDDCPQCRACELVRPLTNYAEDANDSNDTRGS